jgi:diguanylate cyclase (GGDEF)-like protein
MSADQITVVLVILVVILVANLAIMAAFLLGGSRRRRAARAGDSTGAGRSTVESATREPSVVPSAALGASALPGEEADPASPFAAAAGSGARSGVDAAPTYRLDGSADEDALSGLLVDRTTGLDSRLAWERTLRDEDARQARYRRPVTVVILELEGLDRLAGRLGQDVADRILVAVAGTVRANARTSDRAAVLGSGRFGVVLPETDEVQAVNFVERVRGVCDLWLEATGVSVHALFGWASPGPGADLRTARRLAEERLDRDRRQPPPPRAAGIAREPAATGGQDDGYGASGDAPPADGSASRDPGDSPS